MFESDAFEDEHGEGDGVNGVGADVFSEAFQFAVRLRQRNMVLAWFRELCLDIKPAIFDWICKYDYKKNLATDVVSGIVISVVLLPQGLSYASLADVAPSVGVFAGIFPALVYSFWGVSPQGAVGPMSIPALMSGVAIDDYLATKFPNDEAILLDIAARTRAMAYVSFTVGLVVTIIGTCRLGFLLDFVSQPVLTGFIMAACTITILACVKDLLGLHMAKSSILHEMIQLMSDAVAEQGVNMNALAVGLVSLIFLMFVKQLTFMYEYDVKCSMARYQRFLKDNLRITPKITPQISQLKTYGNHQDTKSTSVYVGEKSLFGGNDSAEIVTKKNVQSVSNDDIHMSDDIIIQGEKKAKLSDDGNVLLNLSTTQKLSYDDDHPSISSKAEQTETAKVKHEQQANAINCCDDDDVISFDPKHLPNIANEESQVNQITVSSSLSSSIARCHENTDEVGLGEASMKVTNDNESEDSDACDLDFLERQKRQKYMLMLTKILKMYLPAPLLLIILTCAIFGSQCEIRVPPDIKTISVSVVGASLPSSVYNISVEQYSCFAGDKISMQDANMDSLNIRYNATGSGSAKAVLLSDENELWVNSDSYFEEDQIELIESKKINTIVFPSLTVAVTPLINLGLSNFNFTDNSDYDNNQCSDLVLTPEVLGLIFTKNITHWTDPRIISLNPVMYKQLVNADVITTVVRADESGTTKIFCAGMQRLDEQFAQNVSCVNGYLSYKHNGSLLGDVRAHYTSGVMDAVQSIHGSIGYVSVSDATRTVNGFTNTSAIVLRNPKTKEVVWPSSSSLANQMKHHTYNQIPTFHSSLVNSSSLMDMVGYWNYDSAGDLGWPFSSYTLGMFERVPRGSSYPPTAFTNVPSSFKCKVTKYMPFPLPAPFVSHTRTHIYLYYTHI